VAVRWYLRYGRSFRDVEELLAERGVEVDHVTVCEWVQRFSPCWLTRPASPGTVREIGDSLTRPTSKSTASGASLTGRRPARAGHRRARLQAAGRGCGPPVLLPCVDRVEGDPDRGGHRRRAGLPTGPRRTGLSGVASRGTLRQQADRSRPQPTQTPVESHARPPHRAHRAARHQRAPRSCRISAADTTNSPSKPHARYELPPRSPNSPRRSDSGLGTATARPPIRKRNSAPPARIRTSS
jgi:hypothetical protein